MKYQVTARKWRPQLFGEVIGQEHVTRALRNALSSGKISQAYLFSGPRGVGKTTTARILAKALNYPGGPNPDPVEDYELGQDIMQGQALDVREIDGASNRGIENIREIRENVVYKPLSANYKIYIIDEVHMLTTEASNALLKTLEEPPEHVIFIMATTEAHKVLATIRSRTQHYVFKRISTKVIVEQLKMIVKSENLNAEEKALYIIANAAEGSMRDAQSLFDQVLLYSDGTLTQKSAEQVLGVPDEFLLKGIFSAVINNNMVEMLETVQTYLENIGDIKLLVKSCILYLRNALLARKLPLEHSLIDMSRDIYEDLRQVFTNLNDQQIIDFLNLFVEVFPRLKGDADERFLLETTLFKALNNKREALEPGPSVKKEMSQPAPLNRQPAATRETASSAPQDRPTVQESRPQPEPIPALAGPVNPAQIKEAFFTVLSKNPLTRHYSSHIQSFSKKGNSILVQISQAHIAELLSTNKEKIQKEVGDITGTVLNFEFVFNKENPESGSSPSPVPALSQPVEKTESPAMTTGSDNITDTIINLFDGKIQK